jgi:putative transcriptional regulator
MAKKYKSDIARSVHLTASGLAKIGVIDKVTMREFDRTCLTKTVPLSATEIRAIREKAGVSQAMFAEYIGVTAGLVSKWECGEKRPSGPSLKLLTLVKVKGLAAVA